MAQDAGGAADAASAAFTGLSPSIELDERTKTVLAGQADAQGKKEQFEEYLCTICLSHVFDNSVTTPCEHLFHKDCIADALRGKANPLCPNCKGEIPAAAQLQKVPLCARRTLAHTPVLCPLGCGDAYPFEKLANHVKELDGCPHAVYRCGLCMCQFKRRDLVEHMRLCMGATFMKHIMELKEKNDELGRRLSDCQAEVANEKAKNARFQADYLTRHGYPENIKVSSKEYPKADGQYRRWTGYKSETCNGAPVWKTYNSMYIYKSKLGNWLLADEDGYQQYGCLRNVGGITPISDIWEAVSEKKEWVPAPGTAAWPDHY
eukprot:TRINITY_DN29133_c0_g1_i1.p1 TRINITY_DN29133_c0_g1~~TRINITY_DN29133_c0_g1_i1.p1  ORF type:complete len:347 (+),score=103.05 TRINITY_DN29133_c0_g1_i1:87-1043(+)